MHPLALKSGVHTKMYNTIFYDSDANQVEQKPVFHSGTVVSYSQHSQLEFKFLVMTL